MAATDAPGGKTFKLLHECMPTHEGGVKALAVLSQDVIVSGSDDRMVTVWHRLPGKDEFASAHICPEHQKQVRALVALPPSPAVPTGGFATGCLDNVVRVYQYDEATRAVTLLKSLSGHMAGVISLALTPAGELVSGGWEGQVRVWDLATGACLQVLEGHENGTCVACLPTGEIVVGSTGRKNEYDQPVDFKIRIWAKAAGNSDRPAYTLKKMFEDHTLSVRDLAVLPGTGFISASNDGTVRVRTFDGSVVSTFTNPASTDGHPVFCYAVHVTAAGLIVTCSDDRVARVYTADGLMDEIPLPGTPWRAASLPSGDLVLACDQAGSSRRGHVYVYTAEAGKRCSEGEAARFAKDIVPPSSKPAGEDDSMAGGAGGGGMPDMRILGAYDNRAAIPGTKDGQYGFFKRADGSVFLCSWSAAAGIWADIGEVTDGPGGAGDDDALMMGGGGGSGSSSGGAGAGASGSNWDYVRGVTLDVPSGGMRTMQLCWNEGDDAVTVAKNFVVHNKLSEDAYEEVKNFILDTSFRDGQAVRQRKAAAAAAAAAGGSWTTFPSRGFIDFTTVDWKKVWPKLVDVNKGVPGDVQLSEEELASLRGVVDVLEQTSRYHASTVPRKGVAVLLAKAARWPLASVFPALDVLRVLVIHADGARALEESGPSSSFLDPLLAAVRAGKGSADARPALLLAARALFNAFRHESTRRLLLARSEDVLDCVGDLLAYEHVTVRYAAAVLLHNIAHAFLIGAVDADKAGKPRETGFDAERAQQGVALAHEALGRVGKDDPEAGGLALVLVALGTMLTLGAPIRDFARGLAMDAAVKAAMPAGGAAKGTAEEVLKALAVA